MGLAEQLLQDLNQALRQNDAPRKAAIRMLRAAIQNAEIEKGAKLEDAEILQVLRKEVNKRQEAIELFTKGGRQDLVDKEVEQLKVLMAYLPQQMSREEIEVAAREAIAEVGASGPAGIGPVMRVLMSRLKGRADGKLVNEVVRGLLGNP